MDQRATVFKRPLHLILTSVARTISNGTNVQSR